MPFTTLNNTRLMRLRLVQGVIALMAGCGGGGQDVAPTAVAQTAMALEGMTVAQATSPSQPAALSTPRTTPANWSRIGEVRGLCCSYTPLVVKDGRPHFFSNFLSEQIEGQMIRHSGSWSGVSAGQVALGASDITDVGSSSYKVRTMGIRHDPAVGWVAILRVGRGYPSSDGYVPALATSTDGVSWTYRGKLRIDGRIWHAFADGANLILQMDKPGVLNTQQPFENRYVILDNNFSIDGRARKLIAIVSADGLDWRFHRDSSGQVMDLWPTDAALAADQPVFPTADSVRGDIHLMVGDGWRESASPVHVHRHLCAPRGSSSFRYLGAAATWRSGSKVPNIAYDGSTDTLYAVSSVLAYSLKSASTTCR